MANVLIILRRKGSSEKVVAIGAIPTHRHVAIGTFCYVSCSFKDPTCVFPNSAGGPGGLGGELGTNEEVERVGGKVGGDFRAVREELFLWVHSGNLAESCFCLVENITAGRVYNHSFLFARIYGRFSPKPGELNPSLLQSRCYSYAF